MARILASGLVTLRCDFCHIPALSAVLPSKVMLPGKGCRMFECDDKGIESRAAAAALLQNLRVRLLKADHELRRIGEMIRRTNETIRSSREAILRTNVLVQPSKMPGE